MVGVTIQEQTAQCFRNIEAILHAAGSSLDNVVSGTFILGDPNDFAGMSEEWARWFPKDPPARQGAKLPIQPKGMKISIAVVRRSLAPGAPNRTLIPRKEFPVSQPLSARAWED